MSEDCWGAGAEAATTNNRMELLSVAMLLEAVPTGTPVHIQADSTYVIDALDEVAARLEATGLEDLIRRPGQEP